MLSLPEWLKQLADAVALRILPVDVLAPVGCHYCLVDGTWEIALFAASTQIVGGEKDGRLRMSRFTLDLNAVTSLFTEVTNLTWQAQSFAADDELGPHVSIEGSCGGHSVWLRILSRPPRRFAPGRRAIVYEPAWEETW